LSARIPMKNELNREQTEIPTIKDFNLFIIFSITLFAVMGVASITPAFPQIIKHYNLSVQQIGYLITAFTLPGIFLSLFIGILADRYGRKTILFPSMLIFGVAGFLCAFQSDYKSLLMMRFFQGVGAASLGSLNITLIGDLFDGKNRIKAMGYNASVLSIGTASFPAIGGLFASFDWQYAFYLPVIILPFAFVVLFRLQAPNVRTNISLREYLGNAWKTINRKKVWGLSMVNILVFIILYGAFLSFFPILMETRFQANSLVIGITMSLMSLTTAISSSQLAKVRKQVTSDTLLYLSSLGYAISLVILSFAAGWIMLIIAISLFGIAHGLFIPNIQTALVGMAPLSERAAFMSVNSTVLRIGQTLGPIVVALFYINQNIQSVFLLSAIIALVMIVIIKTLVGKID
ncbi:MFS transporter, partial [Candidatus Neomarinimicrobiota bacterium]